MPVVTIEVQQEAVKAAATKKRVADNASRKGSNKTYNKNVAKEEVAFAVAKGTADAFKNNEGFLMVHTPITIKEGLSNNDAKAALDKEWAKLEKGTKSGPAWDMNKPRSKEQVRRDAMKCGKKVHFLLCNVLVVGLIATLMGCIISDSFFRGSSFDCFLLYLNRDDWHAWHRVWLELLQNVRENLVVRTLVFVSNLVDTSVLSCSIGVFVNKFPFGNGPFLLRLGVAVPHFWPFVIWPCGLMDLGQAPEHHLYPLGGAGLSRGNSVFPYNISFISR